MMIPINLYHYHVLMITVIVIKSCVLLLKTKVQFEVSQKFKIPYLIEHSLS